VGNYQCSVVANVEDLYTTIDWTKFTMPEDLEERLAVLRDEDVVPPDCGFVIAQATTAVQEDGFGVLFPGRYSFFPTCHEGNDSGVHDYDTVCYGFNMMLPMTDGNVENEDVLEDLEAAFDPVAVWSKDGTPVAGIELQSLHRLVRVTLKGRMTNGNVVGRCSQLVPETRDNILQAPERLFMGAGGAGGGAAIRVVPAPAPVPVPVPVPAPAPAAAPAPALAGLFRDAFMIPRHQQEEGIRRESRAFRRGFETSFDERYWG
jgi:hypothetical protein